MPNMFSLKVTLDTANIRLYKAQLNFPANTVILAFAFSLIHGSTLFTAQILKQSRNLHLPVLSGQPKPIGEKNRSFGALQDGRGGLNRNFSMIGVRSFLADRLRTDF